jgi:hypothetical protein
MSKQSLDPGPIDWRHELPRQLRRLYYRLALTGEEVAVADLYADLRLPPAALRRMHEHISIYVRRLNRRLHDHGEIIRPGYTPRTYILLPPGGR